MFDWPNNTHHSPQRKEPTTNNSNKMTKTKKELDQVCRVAMLQVKFKELHFLFACQPTHSGVCARVCVWGGGSHISVNSDNSDNRPAPISGCSLYPPTPPHTHIHTQRARTHTHAARAHTQHTTHNTHTHPHSARTHRPVLPLLPLSLPLYFSLSLPFPRT